MARKIMNLFMIVVMMISLISQVSVPAFAQDNSNTLVGLYEGATAMVNTTATIGVTGLTDVSNGGGYGPGGKFLVPLDGVVGLSSDLTPQYGQNGKFIAPIEAPDPNAIKIYTPQDLHNIRNDLSASYVLMNDIDLAGYNGGEWVPIGDNSTGSQESWFTGVFDGQGNAIKNIRITKENYGYLGLFGYATDGEIKNLGLEDGIIDVASDQPIYAGGVCGLSASISNCYNTGAVAFSSESPSDSYAGGICGAVSFSFNHFINCYNTGKVSSSSPSSYAGGICGLFDNPHYTIVNCFNIGNISTSTYSSQYDSISRVGGICGYSFASFSNCYNNGNISSFANSIGSKSSSYAGGICGSSPSSFSNCYSTGNVSSSASSNSTYSSSSNAGGICGYSSSSFRNCYNTGAVSSASSNSTYSSSSYAGGICGHYASSFSNCYSTGTVSSTSVASYSSASYAGGICGYSSSPSYNNCYNAKTVDSSSVASYSSSSYAGGICGYIPASASYYSISNCYNRGDTLSASSNSSSSSSSYAGGICGYSPAYSLISNCYNNGVISSTNSSSSSSSYAGGICGYASSSSSISSCYNMGNIISISEIMSYAGGVCGTYSFSPSYPSTPISNCYNMGNVTSNSKSSSYAGGICGIYNSSPSYPSPPIKNCYSIGDVASSFAFASYAGGVCGYDGGIASISSYYRSTIAITGNMINNTNVPLATPKMQAESSYTDWDFDGVWGISSVINSSYPYLLTLPTGNIQSASAEKITTALNDEAASIAELNTATRETLTEAAHEVLTALVEDYEAMSEVEKQKLSSTQIAELNAVRERLRELNHTDGEISISDAAWNVRVNAEQCSAGTPVYDDAMILIGESATVHALYSISLSKNGQDYNLPAGQTVTVTISGSFADKTVDTVRILHLKQDDTVEFIQPLAVTKTAITFAASSFSLYAVGQEVVLGDINSDGQISIADVDMAYRAFRELLTLDETQFLAADANKDGKITIVDVDMIYRAFRGLITLGQAEN